MARTRAGDGAGGAVDDDLETMTDEEVAVAVAAIVTGELHPDRFARVALTSSQAMVVADGVRESPFRDDVIRVGRIVGDVGGPRFFDPGDPGAPSPDLVLRRLAHGNEESFELLTDLGYWDQAVGGVIVPGDQADFRTDLTSVPNLFTWLVPRTGTHLPAALVHDGLILSPGEPRSYVGPDVSREDADRIFRDGMGALGTGLIRRWIVWASVALATMWSDPAPTTRWRWRAVIVSTIGIVSILGLLATLDLFDCGELLPWMGDRPVGQELVLGGIGALVIPVLLAVALWWGRQLVGVILGISLAFLLHVTWALAAIYSLYAAAEAAVAGAVGRAARWAAGLALIVGVPALLIWWLCG